MKYLTSLILCLISSITLSQTNPRSLPYDIDVKGYVKAEKFIGPFVGAEVVGAVYSNITDLLAAQNEQITTTLYEITDGSGFTSISNGRIWVRYIGTTDGNELDYIIVSAEEWATINTPVENTYSNISALLADQNNQSVGFLQYVQDASADFAVVSGDAYYEKTATSTASLNNYTKLTENQALALENTKSKYFGVPNASGTYTLDWEKDTYDFTLIGDLVLLEGNLPVSTKNTKVLELYVTGDYNLTFPAAWSSPNSNIKGAYDGTVMNRIRVGYVKYETYWVEISQVTISGGSSNFTSLTDAPSSYSSQAGKIPVVNTGETALEFTEDYFKTYSDSPIKPIFWAGTQAEHDAKFGVGYVHPITDYIVITDGENEGGASETVDSVNGQTGAVVLDADDIDDALTSHKFVNQTLIDKVAVIEAGATADLTAAEIEALLDAYFGNTNWRTGGVSNIELSGTTLVVDGSGGAENVDVDLSSLQDGTGTDDQTAAEVPFTPYETITSTDSQAAINELKDEVDALTESNLNINIVKTLSDFDALISASTQGIWLIVNDITLNANKTLPSGVILQFSNAKMNLSGYDLAFNSTVIDASFNNQIFDATGTFSGTLKTEVFSVKWFGATGDGSTDENTFIQHTIDIAKGKTIVIPSGVYMHSGIELDGASYNNTKILCQGTLKLQADGGSSTFGTTWVGLLLKDVDGVTLNYKGDGNRTAMTDREHIFCVGIAGATNINIPEFSAKEVRGDGIYISQSDWTADTASPSYIDIGNFYISNSAVDGRNAISVIDGHYITVGNLISKNIGGTVNGLLQPGGLVIEPNYTYQSVTNLQCFGGYIESNAAAGFSITGKAITNDAARDWNVSNIDVSLRILKKGTTGDALNASQLSRVKNININLNESYETTPGRLRLIDFADNVTGTCIANNSIVGVELGIVDKVTNFDLKVISGNYSSAGLKTGEIEDGRFTGRIYNAISGGSPFAIQCHAAGRGVLNQTNITYSIDAPYDGVNSRAVRNEPTSPITFVNSTVQNCDFSGYSNPSVTTDADIKFINVKGLTEQSTMPVNGYWGAGSVVSNTSISASGDGTIKEGWLRLTSGNAHVLGTDWVEQYTTPNVLTTKGDLLGFSTYKQRLGVGADGQVLTADSTFPLGMKWSTLSGSGDVSKTGTPVNNQLAIWTSDGIIEGDANATFDGSTLTVPNLVSTSSVTVGDTAGTSPYTVLNSANGIGVEGDLATGGWARGFVNTKTSVRQAGLGFLGVAGGDLTHINLAVNTNWWESQHGLSITANTLKWKDDEFQVDASGNVSTTGSFTANSFIGDGSNLTNLPTFSLTTTGTSGAATYDGTTLNIPQYAGGSESTTVSDTNFIDLTLTGFNITATIKDGAWEYYSPRTTVGSSDYIPISVDGTNYYTHPSYLRTYVLKPLTDTGTTIDMSGETQDNFGAASSATTFTLVNTEVGGYAEVLINAASEPTVTGATKFPNTASFIASTDMILCVKDFNGTRKFWFVEF